MRNRLRYCLLAAAGAAACLTLPRLPPIVCFITMAVLAALLSPRPAARPLAVFLAGVAFSGLSAAAMLADRLSPQDSGLEFKFTAQIVDFPKETNGNLALIVAPSAASTLPRRLRLSWYSPQGAPRLGEHWFFHARLKRPRGSRNPGGFDYAGWLHRQHIGAAGYILQAERRADAAGLLQRVRRRLARRVETVLPAGSETATLLAVTLGARHRITRPSWQLYAVTGTSHLMAISGLHVGLAASGAALLAWGLLAVVLPRTNLRDLATGIALLVAFFYAAVAGFAVPAQRALLMAAMGCACLWWRRPLAAGQALSLVALAVILINPLSLLAPGFWLSFSAVACLLLLATDARTPDQVGSAHWLGQLGRLQIVLLLGLLPLTALLFGRVAWLAPFANALAVPLFSFITVPASLLGLLLGGPLAVLGDALLWLSWYSLVALHQWLRSLAALPGADWPLAAPQGAYRLVLLAPLLWLLPRGFPGRQLAWLGFAGLLFYRAPAPPAGCADLHVLDVGQGLSVVLRTANHNLVYDVGPSWRSGGDSGQSTVLPFLRSLGVRRLDRLVVSHADQDHAGGVRSLLAAMPVDKILSGEPLSIDRIHERCERGQTWYRDRVRFTVLHPYAQQAAEGNDASCVVDVSAGRARLLLAGDIEAASERRLVSGGQFKTTDLVIVPHHGSRTSSTHAFIDALQPSFAIVSAGYGNRWGFPKDDVVARWESAGATVYNTASSGALQFRLCPDSGVTLSSEYRVESRRYWHDE